MQVSEPASRSYRSLTPCAVLVNMFDLMYLEHAAEVGALNPILSKFFNTAVQAAFDGDVRDRCSQWAGLGFWHTCSSIVGIVFWGSAILPLM